MKRGLITDYDLQSLPGDVWKPVLDAQRETGRDRFGGR